MVDERNVHTKEDYERSFVDRKSYVDRNWREYRYLLPYCLTYGEPGAILDIGAGLGYFVECCLKFGLQCTGAEGSEFAIEHARKRGVSLMHLVLDRDTVLPFDNAQFAVVVSNQVAHHLQPDVARRMFKESYRVLKDGGVFIAFEASIYNKEERKPPSHINLFTPSRLRCELKEAGFKILAEPNDFVGRNVVSRTLRRIVYRIVKIESFLNTANAIGQKRLNV